MRSHSSAFPIDACRIQGCRLHGNSLLSLEQIIKEEASDEAPSSYGISRLVADTVIRYAESPSKQTQQRMHMRHMCIIMGIIAFAFFMVSSPFFKRCKNDTTPLAECQPFFPFSRLFFRCLGKTSVIRKHLS